MSDSGLVEEIVRGVLASLAPPEQTAAPQTHGVAVLQINETVITGERIEQELGNQTVITVPERAVLTPSARELIKAKKLKLRRTLKTAAPDDPRLQVICTTDCKHVGRYQVANNCDEAAEFAINAVEQKQLAAVLAVHPEPIAALCNRNPDVRAAVVASLERLETLRTVWQPNVIVFNPQQLSTFQTRRLLDRFAAGGTP